MIDSINHESDLVLLPNAAIPFDVDIDRYHMPPREEKVFTGSCTPDEGVGDRAMNCPCYDMCLGVAVDHEWESFNCEACTYSNRGELNFRPMDFVEIYLQDDAAPVEFVPFDENEVLQQGVYSRAFDFEDTMISMIDQGETDAG